MWYVLTAYILVCVLLCFVYYLGKKSQKETRIAELNKEIAEHRIKEEKDRIYNSLYDLEHKARRCILRYGHCLADDESGQQLIADYFIHICKSWMQIQYPKHKFTWHCAVTDMIKVQKNDFIYSQSRMFQRSILQLEAKLFPLDGRTVAGSFCG